MKIIWKNEVPKCSVCKYSLLINPKSYNNILKHKFSCECGDWDFGMIMDIKLRYWYKSQEIKLTKNVK